MNKTMAFVSFAAIFLGLGLAGCQRGDDPAVRSAAAGLHVPPPTAAVTAPASAGTTRRPNSPKSPVVTSVNVTRIDVPSAEDGRGATVAAGAPLAIEITADAWPVRAIDPVLHVGELEFHHYTFPAPNVLRFQAADASLLTADAEVWIQYGDDAASRAHVADRLEVPR